MSVVQERRCDICKVRHSACSPARSAIRPSNFEACGEAHDADGASTCCSTLVSHNSFVDDELSKDSDDAVSMWQLGLNGFSGGVSGTRSRCCVRACWSVGSAGHSAKRCNEPCPYVRMGKECFAGQNCMLCHMNHTEDDDSIKLALFWVQNTRTIARARCTGVKDTRNVARARRAFDVVERATKSSL
eukprot:TRINITY_DN5187_c0_g5_i1.p1 TRINITY_DN5187_c0_g5~~TRINITY_DN5187_c0_g5_i1.p1  ORF type:complete len:187 (+),score=15.15 TRINITY_DN5187_c0_g5_i1:68-628(+)